MQNISASVGLKGINHSIDVTFIQKLLNAQKIPGETIPLKVDGKIGQKTISRIKVFQKKILHMIKPDGRIDPNGRTIKKLLASSISRPNTKSANTFSFSNNGLDLLKSIEQLATNPYDDQTGKDIVKWIEGATIGYGHLISKSEWTKYENGITQAQAICLFSNDLSPFINTVKTKVTANILQNEFDAMVILTFNIGSNAFANSSALKLINDPNAKTSFKSLEDAWKAWNKSQGMVNNGLINRRQAEWNIYSNGVYKKW